MKTDYTQYEPYNHNHSQERADLNYDNLSKEEQLQFDLQLSDGDNVILKKRLAEYERRINKAIEIVVPFKDDDNGIALMVFKALMNDLSGV
jgi:hypothetical protein